MEAQANGLPVITSTGVPIELNITDLVTFLNLEEPISLWVDTLLSFKENPNRQVQDLIVKKFIEKHFEVGNESERLKKLLLGKGE